MMVFRATKHGIAPALCYTVQSFDLLVVGFRQTLGAALGLTDVRSTLQS